jgi:hypothetical protein
MVISHQTGIDSKNREIRKLFRAYATTAALVQKVEYREFRAMAGWDERSGAAAKVPRREYDQSGGDWVRADRIPNLPDTASDAACHTLSWSAASCMPPPIDALIVASSMRRPLMTSRQ